MTRELGLFLLKTFLIINILTFSCLPVSSTLIRRGKQNEIINLSLQSETTPEMEISSSSTTEILISDSISNENSSFIIPSSVAEISTTSVPVETTSTTIVNKEITKPTIQTSQSSPQQQQPLYPWNIMWNSAQSIFPIISSNWWPYNSNQQNPSLHTISSSSSLSTSSPSTSAIQHLQSTPVASLTLTFGKTSVNNKGIGSNSISTGSGIGIFGCPPPIVISGVCPEATCNCQCDNNNKKIIPSSIQTKPKNTISKSSSSSSSSSSSQTQSFSQVQQQQQTQGKPYNNQETKTKFILPFQSWQDFFLRPVQLISSRGGRNLNITSTKGDQKLY